MNKLIIFILGVLFFWGLVFNAALYAEIIVFKTKTLNQMIIDKDETELRVLENNLTVSYPISEVVSIDGHDPVLYKVNNVLCQSCGTPRMTSAALGTNVDGSKNAEYCLRCFRDGAFVRPDLTMEQMIEEFVKFKHKFFGVSIEDARKEAWSFIPKLKRWQNNTP